MPMAIYVWDILTYIELDNLQYFLDVGFFLKFQVILFVCHWYLPQPHHTYALKARFG